MHKNKFIEVSRVLFCNEFDKLSRLNFRKYKKVQKCRRQECRQYYKALFFLRKKDSELMSTFQHSLKANVYTPTLLYSYNNFTSFFEN